MILKDDFIYLTLFSSSGCSISITHSFKSDDASSPRKATNPTDFTNKQEESLIGKSRGNLKDMRAVIDGHLKKFSTD